MSRGSDFRTRVFQEKMRALGAPGVAALSAGVRNMRQFESFVGRAQQQGERITATRQFALVSAKIMALPDEWKTQFVGELKAFDPRLLARMKSGVPKRKGPPASIYERRWRPAGGAVTLLSTKIDTDAMRLTGGLLTKDARDRGFTLYILDAGRGLKNRVSRPRVRLLGTAPSLVRGFNGTRARFSKYYTRQISPIQPGTYDITFGRVRTWARGEIGPVLDRVYVKALARIGWGGL